MGRLAVSTNIRALHEAIEEHPDAFHRDDPRTNLVHHFAPGMYGREIHMAGGNIIIGKPHKHAHLNIILSGLCTVVTQFGEETLEGPCIFVSQPGTQRAVHVIENTRWVTIHPNVTDTTDVDVLEDYIVASSYEALEKIS